MNAPKRTPSLWISWLVGLGLLSCTRTPEKAPFRSCEKPIARRDIVFIVDQSGTMHDNDQEASRWEVVRTVVERLFDDEERHLRRTGKNADATALTQIAVIPFGTSAILPRNADGAKQIWFTRKEQKELTGFLQHWKEQSRDRRKTQSWSNFSLPFALLEEEEWRWRSQGGEVERYIFFISDGRYNIRDHTGSPRNKKIEEREFDKLLQKLRSHQGEWPVYFIGLGATGLDRAQEPNVNLHRLARMAQAISLPDTPALPHSPPCFSEPGLIQCHLVTLIDAEQSRNLWPLQKQLQQVLRLVRLTEPESLSASAAWFPVVAPGQVEITVEVDREITTTELVKKLKLFFKSTSAYKQPRELQPVFAQNPSAPLPAYLHTLVVDTLALRRELPEALNSATLQHWGIKAVAPDIALRHAGLAIKDNWKVWVDRCDIVPAKQKRSTWRRLFRMREPPRYALELVVRARHDCQASLPQARLFVRIPELGEWFVTGAPQARNGNTYTWELTLPHHGLFARRIGSSINVEVSIADLDASKEALSTLVPLHAQALTNRLETTMTPQENHSN